MNIGVEISLYPLNTDYIPPIKDFIARLNGDPRLRVLTNTMTTQVFGDFDVILPLLQRELRQTLTDNAKAVFVMKVLGPMAAQG